MNEARRLVYLDALGIQQWVAKAPLANAKATEFIEQVLVSHVQDVNIEKQAPTNTQPIIAKPIISQPVIVKPAIAEAVIVEPLNTEQTNSQQTTPTEQKQNIPTYALQIQGKRGQYLLIADLQDARGKIQASEQNLLNNISKAISGLLANNSTATIMPELFKWPMFESHYKAEHINQSEQAAKESAQAFLYAQIKRNQLPLIIALGEPSQRLLGLDALENNQHSIKHFGNTHFILAASLADMLNNSAQAHKADLWKKLTQHFV